MAWKLILFITKSRYMVFVSQVCEICYWAVQNTLLLRGRKKDLVLITHVLLWNMVFMQLVFFPTSPKTFICSQYWSFRLQTHFDKNFLKSWKSRASKITIFCLRTKSTYRHTIKFTSEDKILILHECIVYQ